MFKSYGVFGRKALYSAILALGLLLLIGEPVSAALPQLPQLALVPPSFTGPLPYGNNTFYPDGRIWATRSPENGALREILVPVLIKNTWVTDPQLPLYQARPILSFDFRVQYDGEALEAIGVQKMGPRATDTFSLAKDFKLDWDVAVDLNYKKSLDPSQANNPNGRRIRITGTSAHPLPPSPPENATSHNQREFVELVYIRFRVLQRTSNPFPTTVPLILTNDTLMYNDMDVKDMQFQEGYNPPAPNEEVPGVYAGLAGIDNEGLIPDVTEPTRLGVVYVNFADPGTFEFTPPSDVQPVPGKNGEEWQLVVPMTIEKFQTDPDNVVRREFFVENGTPFTRITNIKVTSDAPWLSFNTEGGNGTCPGPTRSCEIDMLDNGILGTMNPLGVPSQTLPLLRMEVIADPNAVGAGAPYYDGAGVYVGYITFSSQTAEITPVRLKVIFIVYRNPLEPLDPSEFENQDMFTNGTGIKLTVENSRTPADRTNLLFGTGVGASLGIDPLFAEAEFPAPLGSEFGARWMPVDNEGNPIAPNGLRDLTGRSASRDIRDVNSRTAHTYCLDFSAGAEENYPVVFTFDKTTVPQGARLFIRNPLNNAIVDFNTLTPVPGNSNLVTFTVTDARIKSLCIEYAPATVMDFPLVQKGWNLVSLPVRPGDSEYRQIFPNALEAPRFFSANDYFQEPNGMMRFGVGYFVKYGNILDTKMAGVPVYEVGANTPYRILLREGWNTIGALSCPLPIEEIRFDAYDNQPLPRRVSDVYRYRTDRGYEPVSVIEPGIGYWIKIEGDGYLKMKSETNCLTGKAGVTPSAGVAMGNKLTVLDNAMRQGTIYVASGSVLPANRFMLPPVPSVDMFDVRFANGRYIDNSQEPVVEINGASYPVVLTMENADVHYTVVDAVSGEVLGSIQQGVGGSVEIRNPKTFAVKLLTSGMTGEAYGISQNMPNPVNGSTDITFTLPQTEKVTVKLYDMMGQEIATVFEGVASAGETKVSFDASQLNSGTYTYTISAGSFTATRRMVVVK